MKPNIFDTPEFKEWGRKFDAGMKDADKAPDMKCPVCGNEMAKVVGFKFEGYQCSGFDCVGIRLTVEDLINPELFEVVCAEAKDRHNRREEMRKRNGFSRHCNDEFKKIRDSFYVLHHIEERPLQKALIAKDKNWVNLWQNYLRQNSSQWCGTCRGYHLPTEEHPFHELCGSVHAPMPADIFFDYRGWKFTPPFICMGCGVEICFRQWAFSRSCGPCDISESRTRRVLYRQCFAGPHVKLSTWDAKENDIPEGHFIDPKHRNKYPVQKPMKMRFA